MFLVPEGCGGSGLEPQVRVVSLMALILDRQAGAEYPHRLAEALERSRGEVDARPDKARAPRLHR